MKFTSKYHREKRNGKEFWTCELWSGGIFCALGSGTTKEKSRQNALNNYNKEKEKYAS